ncbi:MAG: aldehyde dehydrogenase family protein [Spirochaetales bacterium]|nr:aldehyde dehydrogenase family protein [Spirochaetales bacterium]
MKKDVKYYDLYINGEWTKCTDGAYFPVENPANEEITGYAADAGSEDVERALDAATEAQSRWQALSPFQRASYLYDLMNKLEARREFFADLLCREQGKTYRDALGEVDDTIAYMKFAADSAGRIKGDILASPVPGRKMMIERVPYGVVLALCAWNYPLALVGRKLGPALVTGNTLIIKPHELTPLATAEFMNLVDEAGFPPGVVNLITGRGIQAGDQLARSPRTKLISLTGSVAAGQAVYKAASVNITGLILELGGKAPFIVLEDADLEKAAQAAVVSRFSNCGQVCICSDMIFVQESVKDEFTALLQAKVKEITVGDPLDPGTQMGPKASRGDVEKIDGIVQRSLSQGARALTGGKPLTEGAFSKGFWYPATILTDVKPDMDAAREETFGPILPVLGIKDFDEAVGLCNAGPYGLAAYLFTGNHSIIMEASGRLEVGTVFINQPIDGHTHGFHSGHKLSGLGGEDGEYGLEGYMQKRTLYMDLS